MLGSAGSFTLVSLICLFINPNTIDMGSDSFFAGLTKVLLYVATAIALYFAVKRGERTLEKTEKAAGQMHDIPDATTQSIISVKDKMDSATEVDKIGQLSQQLTDHFKK